MCCSVLCGIFKGGAGGAGLCKSLGYLFFATLPSPGVCPVNSSHFGPPGSQLHFLNLRRLLGSIWITVSVSWSGMTLNIVCGCNPGAHLICCSQRSHCPLSLDGQCFKNTVSYILLIFHVVLDRRINLAPSTPNWSGA